ncbi:MAG: hypothetical protein IPL65_00785 [Lewinellaceae bacterium]|nr:hypothetical protein [Lewinellaceae bacterium]
MLIDDTPMPRAEELPENLKPLLRFNAINISDRRWQHDVLRLGKIIALDIPSSNERKIDMVRLIITTAMFFTLGFSALKVVWNYLGFICMGLITDPDARPEKHSICWLIAPDFEPNMRLLSLWQAEYPISSSLEVHYFCSASLI